MSKLILEQLSPSGDLYRSLECEHGALTVFSATSHEIYLPFISAFENKTDQSQVRLVEDGSVLEEEIPLLDQDKLLATGRTLLEIDQLAKPSKEEFSQLLNKFSLNFDLGTKFQDLTQAQQTLFILCCAASSKQKRLALLSKLDQLDQNTFQEILPILKQNTLNQQSILLILSSDSSDFWHQTPDLMRYQVYSVAPSKPRAASTNSQKDGAFLSEMEQLAKLAEQEIKKEDQRIKAKEKKAESSDATFQIKTATRKKKKQHWILEAVPLHVLVPVAGLLIIVAVAGISIVVVRPVLNTLHSTERLALERRARENSKTAEHNTNTIFDTASALGGNSKLGGGNNFNPGSEQETLSSEEGTGLEVLELGQDSEELMLGLFNTESQPDLSNLVDQAESQTNSDTEAQSLTLLAMSRAKSILEVDTLYAWTYNHPPGQDKNICN